MARPRSIDDREILQAAREVFMERGIAGTTAEVAERAGVSEGSIFNRFGSKRALFLHAMKPDPDSEPWLLGLTDRVGKGDLQAQLVEVTTEGVEFFRGVMPRMMLLMSNPPEGGEEGARRECGGPAALAGDAPIRALQRITAYIEAEAALGRLRAVSPEILARALLAGMNQYALFEMVLQKLGRTPLPVDVYARGLVDVLWNGVAPAHSAETEEAGT